MNEMIIEGKFINIKEDIAILNDEVDNYIENVLSDEDILKAIDEPINTTTISILAQYRNIT